MGLRHRFGRPIHIHLHLHIHGHNFKITGTDAGPIPPSAQWPETTVDVPPGATRDIEFVADNPGDWAFHCHKNHHVMNQMSHEVPNLIGVAEGNTEKKVKQLLPGYMAMGEKGMGEMAEMNMGGPKNWVPMMNGEGQFGPLEMGGMFTVVKIRAGITSYDDPGDYAFPAGTVAQSVAPPGEPVRPAIPSQAVEVVRPVRSTFGRESLGVRRQM